MALPAGRYGVTKNQLLKIKKLPMNTIKLIEELTEKFDLLGTAAFKNSTSVVTQSTDLVESGAVKDIVGWGNANIADNYIDTSTVLAGVTLALNSDKTITLSGTSTSAGSRNCCEFLGSYLKSKGDTLYVSGGVANKAYIALRNNDYSYAKVSRGDTVEIDTSELLDDANYYITLDIEASGIDETGVVIKPMLSKEGGAYEPYHESVEQILHDAEVIPSKNLLPNSNAKSTTVGANLTVTVDDNGVIDLHGTAPSTASTIYTQGTGWGVGILLSDLIDGVDYVWDYGKTDTEMDATRYCLYGLKNGNVVFNAATETQAPLSHQFTYNSNIDAFFVYVRIPANATYNHFKLYPMICTLAEWNKSHDYEPYYVPLKDVVPTKADNSVIGTVEDGANPTKAYAVNEFMVRDGAFCQVTAPVTTSSTWTEGSNYTKKSIAEVLQSLMS